MLTTSAEFQTKINANARKIYGKIRINYTDPLLDQNIIESSADENYISWINQFSNGRTDMSYKYIALNDNSTLDGTYSVAPDTSESANFNEFGWWSASVSSALGVVDATAQVEFSSRKVSGYFIAFDSKREEYAIDYTVKFYNGVTLVYTETVTGNTNVKETTTFTQIDNIDKVVLNITKWSEPNTPVKLVEFTTQVVEEYVDDSLCFFNMLEEREISNDNSIPVGNISSSELQFCLMNSNRVFDAGNTASRLAGLIKPNAFVEAFIGIDTATGIEYQPSFKGWTTEWDVPEQDVTATASARDRLNLLTQTQYTTSTVQEDLTFLDWFELVLNDAGLTTEQYNVDTTLDGTDYIVPYGWFDSTTHRDALELLAQGCSAVVYVDREGLIQVKALDNFPAGSVKTYTRDDYTDKDNQPIYQNVANDISVTTSPLEKTTEVTVYTTLSSDPETIAANTTEDFTIFYTDAPITDHEESISPTVPGVSITASTHYSWGSVLTVQNTNGTEQSFQFSVTGSTFEVKGQKTVNRTDTTSIESNGRVAFTYPQNRFLQNKTLATDIADNLLASFKDAQRDLSISFDVGGNPTIELGDTITVTDLYGSKDYKIISTELNYDGGLGIVHKGRV